MEAKALARAMRNAMIWHAQFATRPGKAFRGGHNEERTWTPYGIHPTWAAMTILHERDLPQNVRADGAMALLYHDVLEDTTKALPRDLPKSVRELVEAMTFESFDQETELLWQRAPVVRLLKAYDKVSNWMDGAWMYPDRRILHRAHLIRIVEDVERNFGTLNIVLIAKALLEEP